MTKQRLSKAPTSFLFKLLESFGMQGIAFVVNIIIARVLDPSDYGVLTMLIVFIAIAQVFIQNGLTTSLIRQKTIKSLDYVSVFWFNLGFSFILYLILFFSAPIIAQFYSMPELTKPLRILSLLLFPSAFLSVQQAVVARNMAFKQSMICSLVSTFISGSVGIALAYYGAGYYALVFQQLSSQIALVILLFFVVKWTPSWNFSFDTIKIHYNFGWKLILSSFLETGYNNLRTLIIGKQYTPDALGYYQRGKQFPELLMNAVNGSIQSVMLPVLSESQHDTIHMKAMLKKSINLSTFIIFPAMAGLAAVAPALISLLLTEKWLFCVPFLQICCIDFAFYPIHTANLQSYNALGRSDIFLKLEFIKKSFGLLVLFVSVVFFQSIYAIAWGAVISTIFAAFVNAAPNKKLLNYSNLEQMKDLLPTLLLSLLLFISVSSLSKLPLTPILTLGIQCILGIIIYFGLALLFKMESMNLIRSQLQQILKKKRT